MSETSWGSDVGFQLLKLHGFLERICPKWCIQKSFHCVPVYVRTWKTCWCTISHEYMWWSKKMSMHQWLCYSHICLKKLKKTVSWYYSILFKKRHQLRIMTFSKKHPALNCWNCRNCRPKWRGRSTTFSRAWPGSGIPIAKLQPCEVDLQKYD
jgi:hypothetical protein